MAKWFVNRNGKQAGPFVSSQLKQLATDGKIKPNDQIRRDDQEAWHKAESVKGLFDAPKPEQARATQPPIPVISSPVDIKKESNQDCNIPPPLPNQSVQKQAGRLRWYHPFSLMLLAACAIILLFGIGSFFASTTDTGTAASNPEKGNSGAKKGKRAGFDQSDYVYDFSGAEYDKIPSEAKPSEKEETLEDGRVKVRKGYIAADGAFITHGKVTIYRDSTKTSVQRENWFIDGKLHGVCKFFSREGKESGTEPWVHGNQHGIAQVNWANGNRQYVQPFINGQKHGLHEKWYENGQKASEETFVNGSREGNHTYWFEDGSIQKRQSFRSDKRSGAYEHYRLIGTDKKRTLSAKGEFDQDKLIGKWSILVECRDRLTTEFQEIKVDTRPWTGGTRKELLAKLALFDYFYPDVKAIWGSLGVHLLGKRGPLPSVYGATFGSANRFTSEFGLPDFEMPDPEYRSDNLRLFRYDCTDGPLIFKATLQYPNGLANGVRIVLVSDTTINKP